MNIIQKFFILFLALPLLMACNNEDKEGTIELSIVAEMNGKPIDFGIERYMNSQGQFLRFTDFVFYLSDLEFTDKDGAAINFSEVILHDLKNPKTYTQSMPIGRYEALNYKIGLTPEQNNGDPADYEATHPLSTIQQMHWGWASKYKFIKTEGKVDTEDLDILETSFAYHTGFEELTRAATEVTDFKLKEDQVVQVELRINLDTIFDGIDMIENNTSHTLTATATKIHDNFVGAVEAVVID